MAIIALAIALITNYYRTFHGHRVSLRVSNYYLSEIAKNLTRRVSNAPGRVETHYAMKRETQAPSQSIIMSRPYSTVDRLYAHELVIEIVAHAHK